LAERFFDIELTWKVTFALSCVLAIFGFALSRILFGWIFRSLFGPEGRLHHFSEGVPGGIISLIPSLIIVLFLFFCTRIAGTVLELNHIATLCQGEVMNTTSTLPGYPAASKWRNAIDRLPVVPDLLDAIDPSSHRGNRNVAGFVMVKRSDALREFCSSEPETSDWMQSPRLAELAGNEDVIQALASQERVAFVMLPEIRNFAAGVTDQKSLREFEWQPSLESFAAHAKANAPSGYPTETEQEQN
ncbi:MAG: hypothetical protein AAF491_01295, partial [Verrucomicrobiota bacterium]